MKPALTGQLLSRITETSKQQEDYFPPDDDKTVATFWRQATPGTTYWRGYVPFSRLPGRVIGLKNEYVHVDQERRWIDLDNAKGVQVWQFLGDQGRSRVAFQLQKQGVETWLEVDDNYLTHVPNGGGVQTWAKTIDEGRRLGTGYSHEMHRILVPMFDGVIVATDYLAELYQGYNDNVHVCRNSIAQEDWNIQRTESETIRVGYYGSPSHAADWQYVKKAFKKLERIKGVETVVIGFHPPGWSGRCISWSDSLEEARSHLGHIDIGVAPLRQNKWANSKSDVKALEYTMAGVVPVLQDCPPYSPWKKDIGWELMPQSAEQWTDMLVELVRNPGEIDKYRKQAQDYVLSQRIIEVEVENWRRALGTRS